MFTHQIENTEINILVLDNNIVATDHCQNGIVKIGTATMLEEVTRRVFFPFFDGQKISSHEFRVEEKNYRSARQELMSEWQKIYNKFFATKVKANFVRNGRKNFPVAKIDRLARQGYFLSAVREAQQYFGVPLALLEQDVVLA